MKSKNYFIVQYNDCYGNGDNKKLETIVQNYEQFLEWLKKHNEERISDGFSYEEEIEEFSLIPVEMFKP